MNKILTLSQSAFAGYGLEEGFIHLDQKQKNGVAIRFRWIWVGRELREHDAVNQTKSQSAFAGYGLKELPTG